MYETLRIFGSIPIIPKWTPRERKLGKINLPAGTVTHLHASGIQRSAQIWGPDSEVFQPKRWFVDKEIGESASLVKKTIAQEKLSIKNLLKANKNFFIPFSEGARSCLGKRFAEVEFQTCLAMICQKYVIKVPIGVTEEYLLEPLLLLTLSNKNPVNLVFQRRK